jgi:adhesin transport system membrane fusion protein
VIWTYFLLLLALIVTALAVIFYFVPIDKNVKAKGTVVPRAYEEVRSKVPGIIQEIYIREGDSVEAGDRLALINDNVLQEKKNNLVRQREEWREDIRRLEDRIELSEKKIFPSEMFKLDQNIHRARLDKQRAEKKYERFQELSSQGLSSEIEKEEAELEVKMAESALSQLEEEKRLRHNKQFDEMESLKTQLRQREEMLREARKNLKILEESLDNVTVLAPCGGIVLTYEVHKKKGSYVTAGQSFMEIGDKEDLVFKAKVEERDVSDVSMGNTVKIFLNAFPKRKYDPLEGQVALITEISAKEPGSPFYVEVPLSRTFYEEDGNPEGERKKIRPGMLGEAEILVDEDSTIFDNILDSLLK